MCRLSPASMRSVWLRVTHETRRAIALPPMWHSSLCNVPAGWGLQGLGDLRPANDLRITGQINCLVAVLSEAGWTT